VECRGNLSAVNVVRLRNHCKMSSEKLTNKLMPFHGYIMLEFILTILSTLVLMMQWKGNLRVYYLQKQKKRLF